MEIGTGRTFISIFILCIAVALPITRVGSFGEAAHMRVVRQGPPPGPLKFEVASIKPSKAGEPQTGKDYSFVDRDQMRIRRPAAYYLNNQHDLARSYLMQGLEEIGENSGPVSDQYRRFAKALLTRLAANAPVSS